MKKIVLSISAILLIMVASCKEKTSVLTNAQKEIIKKEVQAQYENFNKSINAMDIDLFRQSYSENNFLVAVFGGVKIGTYEVVIDSVNSWWSRRSEQAIDKSDVQIDILSNDLAIVTSFVEGHITLKNGAKWGIKNHAISLLYSRETSGWKIIYYHESGQ